MVNLNFDTNLILILIFVHRSHVRPFVFVSIVSASTIFIEFATRIQVDTDHSKDIVRLNFRPRHRIRPSFAGNSINSFFDEIEENFVHLSFTLSIVYLS